MEKIRQTPSQTVGPFFAYGLTAEQYKYDFSSILDHSLIGDHPKGNRIEIVGQVFDGDGKAIHDAMVELWQADESGNYRSAPIEKTNDDFKGYGRLGTGTDPRYNFRFTTIRPGAVKGQAPHINVILFMRGSLLHMYTRLYFSDQNNGNDPLLSKVEPNRRATLIAQKEDNNAYRFDIHMQGSKETVFFEL